MTSQNSFRTRSLSISKNTDSRYKSQHQIQLPSSQRRPPRFARNNRIINKLFNISKSVDIDKNLKQGKPYQQIFQQMSQQQIFKYLFRKQKQAFQKLFLKYNIVQEVDNKQIEEFIEKGKIREKQNYIY